ncbi:2-hydroxyacid dehydrogenase [Paenibacillus sp. GCM10023252]|uniref:2-hydroxyacid dehydrogenase n=1 Tax=Paenibacillus sp. GCM10023252 TaxID=3252649 RepID=UPI0036242FEF
MTKPVVFISRPVPEQVQQYISEHCECIIGQDGMSRESIREAMAEAEGLLTSGMSINAELLDASPKLRIVSNISVGYNNMDLDEMKRRGVMGTNTGGALDDTVADLILALMLAVSRRVTELDRLVRRGAWVRGMNEELFGMDVHHRTVGIIGLGRIGEAVARRAHHGFSMKVLYHKRSRSEEAESRYDAEFVSLNELLSRSDFVVVMTPLTEHTRKLIGKEQLQLMKSSSVLINASRGAVVDEQALVEALAAGTIAGAGLDVFEKEPIAADHPLLSMEQVVVLPHIGSATQSTRFDMAMLAARNLVAGVKGETPPNLLPELA